ncbi:hypothetical protein [Cognatiluteimonas profundi]|uniref:hypothetical protein n=1 Tax=Cognatiluteimonas profundi TaxID=2594501 RepID=UPI00131B178A|nr:hypothetical protein [Lysobacter profundi]
MQVLSNLAPEHRGDPLSSGASWTGSIGYRANDHKDSAMPIPAREEDGTFAIVINVTAIAAIRCSRSA